MLPPTSEAIVDGLLPEIDNNAAGVAEAPVLRPLRSQRRGSRHSRRKRALSLPKQLDVQVLRLKLCYAKKLLDAPSKTDGVVLNVHFDIQLPSEPAHAMAKRWMKLLDRAQRSSAPVRVLGLTQRSDTVWTVNEASVFILQGQMVDKADWKIFEAFAGGYGGWGRSISWLNRNLDDHNMRVVGGMDKDPSVEPYWKKNQEHDAQFFCADATQFTSWEHVRETDPSAITLSAPCQSFSFAGTKAGWDSVNGAALAMAMWYCHLSGYQVIFVENVAGLKKRQDWWKFFQELCEFCGFKISHHAVINMSHLHPVDRERLLVVLESKQIPTEQKITHHDWINKLNAETSLWECNRWFTLPKDLEEETMVYEPELSEYAKVDRLPPNLKQTVVPTNRLEVLHTRLVRSNRPIRQGTVMAQYGNQHNLPGYILGSLRMSGENFRRLHPLELVGSMGTTTHAFLPKELKSAYMIIGNAISEFHGLCGLLMYVSSNDATINPLNLLKKHASECLNAKNCQMIEIGSDKVLTHAMLPTKIQTIGETMIEPSFICRIGKHVKVHNLLAAEQHLNPFKRQLCAFDRDDCILEPDAPAQALSVSIAHAATNPCKVQYGVFMNWSGGSFRLDVPFTTTLQDCWIDGVCAANIPWARPDGNQFMANSMFGWSESLSTTQDLGWDHLPQGSNDDVAPGWDCLPQGVHITVVRLHYGEVTTQRIRVGPEETVESLLHAEQILSSLDVRVVEARDRHGMLLQPHRLLNETPVVCIRLHNPHHRIPIMIRYQGVDKEQWWPKGTRAFQIWNPQHDQMLVDDKGTQIPWDMPLFQGGRYTVIDHPDEEAMSNAETEQDEISPTIPFILRATPPPMSHVDSATPDVREMVRGSTIQMTQALMQVSAPADQQHQNRVQQRLTLLCMQGLAMGNDEMMFHLGQCEDHAPCNNLGIASWNEPALSWIIDGNQDHSWRVDHDKQNIGALHVRNHWMPLRIRPHAGIVELWNDSELTPDQETMLMKLLCMETSAIEMTSLHAMPNCCGFHTIAILREKLQIHVTPHASAADTTQLSQYVDPEKVHQFCSAIEECADDHTKRIIVWCRERFVEKVVSQPTMPKFHGKGEDDVPRSHLRMAGQIAAILISRGHRDSEATKAGHELASRDIKSLRAINSMKEQKAYGLILESCIKHSVPLEGASKNQAILKLQSFFRSKHSTKASKASQPVDIKQVRFLPRSFMIMNAHYVDPQPTWSAATRGIAVAELAEINEMAHQGKILTSDANSVLTTERPDCTDQVTTEQVIVPVQDQSMNKALIRLWVTHFGQKKVIRAPEQNGSISLEKAHTLALHVHRELVDEEFWSQMVLGPVKTILNVIKGEGMKTSQVYSRRWTLNGKQCEPKLSTAFSVLVKVDESQVDDWLEKSGMTQPVIFVQIKKQEDGSDLTDSYRIIWLGKQLTDAISTTSSLDAHAGVIFKPPSSFGARVHVDHHDEAWKSVKGSSEPIPKLIPIKHKYLISNLPPNMTAGDLENWAKQLSWVCRVLRRFNNNNYLIGSPNPIPTWHMSLNGHSVLVAEFQDQKKPVNNIIAGKLQHIEKMPTEAVELDEDPWKGQSLGRTPRAMQNAKQAWAAYKPTTVTDASTVPAATEKRINTLEKEMQAMKEQIGNQHVEHQKQFNQLDSKVSDLQQSLHRSLRDALSEQSSSLIATFESLMAKGAAGAGKDARERSRSGGKH
eukprot:Skav201604  [mRNA]  locus=scaffold152:871969:881890:+ [translate_table: standard]